MEGTIYVVKNDMVSDTKLSLFPIATFKATITNAEVTLIGLTPIDVVNQYNKQVCMFIARSKYRFNSAFGLYQVIAQSGDITGILLAYLRYRRCTGYVVLQISSLCTRLMVYYDDVVVHNAMSFGTSCEYAIINLREQLPNIISDATKQPTLHNKLNSQLILFI